MSHPGHPDEALLTTYADDALERPGRAQLEGHLMRCRECRTRVVALRDESSFLSDVLHERERSVPLAAPVPEIEAGVALSLPLAIAAVTAIFAVAGVLIRSRLPGGLDVINPLRLKGAYEMAFDFLFFVRDAAPGLVELAVSLGAVTCVSALLTFAVGLLYRKLFGTTAGVLLGLVVLGVPLFGSGPADAIVFNTDEEVHVARDEVVEESMVLTGDHARIDGTVKGDVVAALERIQITGRVEGNLYLFAGDLDLTGSVGGTLHTISRRARIDGEIDGGAVAVSAQFILTSDGRVQRDAWLILAQGVIDGELGRDALVGGEDIDLGGSIARNLEVRFGDRVRLRSDLRVGGDADIWISDDDDFEADPAAEIGGALQVHQEKEPSDRVMDRLRPRFYLAHAVVFAASFAFGLLLYALLPGVFEVGIRTAGDFFRHLLMGFVLLVVPPFAILLVGLTLVGLPIAVLGSFVYVTCLYGAELLVGMWIGRTLLGRENAASLWSFARVFFVGTLIIALASHLPFVGTPIAILSVVIGLGLLFERARRLLLFGALG